MSFMNLLVQMLMVDPEQRLTDAGEVLSVDMLCEVATSGCDLNEMVRDALEEL